MNPFDVLNSVNHNKKDLLDAENESKYPAFMVNRGLSYFNDTVLLANEMNRNHHLDARLQFDFLRIAIRPRKRFSKWAKKEKIKAIDLIKEVYGYSTPKAEAVLDLFTDKDLEVLASRIFKGGKNAK
jgi:hypothetical protein